MDAGERRSTRHQAKPAFGCRRQRLRHLAHHIDARVDQPAQEAGRQLADPSVNRHQSADVQTVPLFEHRIDELRLAFVFPDLAE